MPCTYVELASSTAATGLKPSVSHITRCAEKCDHASPRVRIVAQRQAPRFGSPLQDIDPANRDVRRVGYNERAVGQSGPIVSHRKRGIKGLNVDKVGAPIRTTRVDSAGVVQPGQLRFDKVSQRLRSRLRFRPLIGKRTRPQRQTLHSRRIRPQPIQN